MKQPSPKSNRRPSLSSMFSALAFLDKKEETDLRLPDMTLNFDKRAVKIEPSTMANDVKIDELAPKEVQKKIRLVELPSQTTPQLPPRNQARRPPKPFTSSMHHPEKVERKTVQIVQEAESEPINYDASLPPPLPPMHTRNMITTSTGAKKEGSEILKKKKQVKFGVRFSFHVPKFAEN